MTQTIERTTLGQLLSNEDYARKVMPHMKMDYFSDRTERTVFEEIQKFVDRYNALPTKDTLEIEIDTRRDLNEDDIKRVFLKRDGIGVRNTKGAIFKCVFTDIN